MTKRRTPKRRSERAHTRSAGERPVTDPSVDLLSAQLLIYLHRQLSQQRTVDAEMDALVRRATAQNADAKARRAAMHAIADLAELRQKEEEHEPATVRIAGYLVSPSPKELLREFLRALTPPKGEDRHRTIRALRELAQENSWNLQRARRYAVRLGIWTAITKLGDQPPGRIGKGSGSGKVVGRPEEWRPVWIAGARPIREPDDPVHWGIQWARQEVPKLAREWLLDWAGERHAPAREERETDLLSEEQWPETQLQAHADERASARFKQIDDLNDLMVRVASANLRKLNPRALLVLMAAWRPERGEDLVSVLERTGIKVTPEHRRIIAADCESDTKLADGKLMAKATGIPYVQVSDYYTGMLRRLGAPRREKTAPPRKRKRMPDVDALRKKYGQPQRKTE